MPWLLAAYFDAKLIRARPRSEIILIVLLSASAHASWSFSRRLMGLQFCSHRRFFRTVTKHGICVSNASSAWREKETRVGRTIHPELWRRLGSYFAHRFGNVTNWCSDTCNTFSNKKPRLIKSLQYITRLVWYDLCIQFFTS